jgi:hypothetical protein
MGVVFVAMMVVFLAAVTAWELSTGVVLRQDWKRKYTRANNPVMYWSVVVSRLAGLAGVIVFLVLVIHAHLVGHRVP